mgnify:CR=1 FL=1
MRQKEGKMTFNQLHYFLEVYSLKSIKKWYDNKGKRPIRDYVSVS